MGDSYPSTTFMGKSTFVLGGVDSVLSKALSDFLNSNNLGC